MPRIFLLLLLLLWRPGTSAPWPAALQRICKSRRTCCVCAHGSHLILCHVSSGLLPMTPGSSMRKQNTVRHAEEPSLVVKHQLYLNRKQPADSPGHLPDN
jgi:hypothetical protein